MLSVIVPVLNEAENIPRLLSALQEACPQAEAIVVDGGSQDGTREAVRRFSGVRLILSRQGRAHQMNAGAAEARGRILLFLHADTWLPLGAAEAVQEACRNPLVVGGRFDVRFDSPRPAFRVIAAFMNIRSRVSGIFTGDQAIFVRREAFEALGGFPEIPLMEDVEFSRRLKRAGQLACLQVEATTSARKWEREGVGRTALLMWSLRLLHALGVSPERLHRWYYPDLRPPETTEGPSPPGG